MIRGRMLMPILSGIAHRAAAPASIKEPLNKPSPWPTSLCDYATITDLFRAPLTQRATSCQTENHSKDQVQTAILPTSVSPAKGDLCTTVIPAKAGIQKGGGLATVVSLETPDIASSGRLRKGLRKREPSVLRLYTQPMHAHLLPAGANPLGARSDRRSAVLQARSPRQ